MAVQVLSMTLLLMSGVDQTDAQCTRHSQCGSRGQRYCYDGWFGDTCESCYTEPCTPSYSIDDSCYWCTPAPSPPYRPPSPPPPSYCTTASGRCTSGSCRCQSSSHRKSSHQSSSGGTCYSCGPPPSPPPPSYCTTSSSGCTKGSCSCQSSSHQKSSHRDSSGTTCFSCGPPPPPPTPPPPVFCTTASGSCTSGSCGCRSSSHLKYTRTSSSGTCYSCAPALSDGDSCSEDRTCGSKVCKGGRCCAAKGRATACNKCTSKGACGLCRDGYFTSNYECIKKQADGGVCTLGSRECTSGVCRGGRCCGAKGQSQGCLGCSLVGACASCDTGTHSLANGQCVARTTTTIITTITTTTTTPKPNGGRCNAAGDCSSGSCTNGRCVGAIGPGLACASGYDCRDSVCRGGVCCSHKGRAAECTQCGPASTGLLGDCAACRTGFGLTAANECKATATAASPGGGGVTVPPSPTAPPRCNTNCTAAMYNNAVCDLACNTYSCRYDHGACSRAMADDLQQARLKAKLGKTAQARALFQIVCDAGRGASPPGAGTVLDVSGAEHKARVKEYDYQQMFAVTSCISAKNLVGAASAKTFTGQDSKQTIGGQSYDKLKTGVGEKLEALKNIDAQIARVKKLSQLFAHRENVGSDGSTVQGGLGDLDDEMYAMISAQLANSTADIQAFVNGELTAAGKVDPAVALLAADLKDYLGSNASDVAASISYQTKALRDKATGNMNRLKDTLALQRRIISETLRSEDEGLSKLEKQADSLAENVDTFVESMAEFGERVGYLNEYSNANPSDAKVDDLVAGTKALSLSQRLVLVGLRQDGEMWAKLDARRSRRAASTVQTAIIDLLDGTRQPEALSAQERNAVNAAMQSELKEVVGFSPLDATRTKLTRAQRKTLAELEANSAIVGYLNEAEKEAIRQVLAGDLLLRDVDEAMRNELNEAMSMQRAMTGFSHSWDDDGDGLVSPTEQVQFIMDTAAPPTLPAGKVLAPFRKATFVAMETAKSLVAEQYGQAAADQLAAVNTQDVTAQNVLDVIRTARRQRGRRDAETVSLESAMEMFEAGRAVYDVGKGSLDAQDGKTAQEKSKGVAKAVAGWKGLASMGLKYVSDVFLNEVDNPVLKGGLGIARDAAVAFATGGNPIKAALTTAAGLACGQRKTCADCLSVVNDVSTGVSVGGMGGAVGAVVGGGLGLIKSAITGGLGKCASGVAKNIGSAFRAGAKLVETAAKFVGKVVYKVAEGVKTVVTSAVNAGRKLVTTAVRVIEDVARTVSNTVYTTVEAVGKGISYVARGVGKAVVHVAKAGFNIVKGAATSVYNGAMSVARGVSSFFGGLTGWWRRRQRHRQARGAEATERASNNVANSTNNYQGHEQESLLHDMALLASAALNLHDASDALYFNGSKGIPVDLGMLSHPEITAKYASDGATSGEQAAAAARATIFADSLTSLQGYAMRKVDLDAQIQSTAYMTDTVGRCLLKGNCDLQDQVDRYALALQLMESRRNEAVFSILEDMTEISAALQFENAAPEALSLNLPDSPSVSDLSQQLAEYDEAQTVAKMFRNQEQATHTALVQYTVSAREHPDEFAQLLSSGFTYITVPAPPVLTKYRDVHLTGGGVFAHIYPAVRTAASEPIAANVKIQKGSYSTFVPAGAKAKAITYFHANADQNPVFSFTYNTDTCAPAQSFAPAKAGVPSTFKSSTDGLYGEWRVELAKGVRNIFARATHLRLTFDVRWHEDATVVSTAGSTNNASNSMFGGDGCGLGAACVVGQGTPLVAPVDCQPLGTDLKTNDGTNADDTRTTAASDTDADTDTSESGGMVVGAVLALAVCAFLAALAYYKRAMFSGNNNITAQKDSVSLRPIRHDANASSTLSTTTRMAAATPDATIVVSPDTWVAESVLDRFASIAADPEPTPDNAVGTDRSGDRHSTAINMAIFDLELPGGKGKADEILAAHSVGALSRQQAECFLQDKGMLPGDFLLRESKSKTILSLVDVAGQVIHNAIRPGPPTSGEFTVNSRTHVAAQTLAELLQQWLHAPHNATALLGSELVLHEHWDAAGTVPAQTSRLAVNAEDSQVGGAANSGRSAIANPQYAAAPNQAGSPHYDTIELESSVSPQALYDMASKSHTYEAFYELATNTKTDGELGKAVNLQAFYDMATNAGNEADSQQTFALHSVGRMSREEATQLLQSKGSLPGDFLIRESTGKHVLSLVKANRAICHHAISPADAGEFVLNGKTKVAARSLAGLLQKWLDTPGEAKKNLGSELALNDHWIASANPYYSLAVSSNPHYDTASSVSASVNVGGTGR